MKFSSGNAFRESLEQRLRNMAGGKPSPYINRKRKLIAAERFLARLVDVAPDNWVVKGGIALDLRLGERARTTNDLDLGSEHDESTTVQILADAAATDLDDYFSFSIVRLPQIVPVDEGGVLRFQLRAELDGRRFELVSMDIGLTGELTGEPDMIRESSFLDFAEIVPVNFPALPLTQHLAEKLHAYARVYAGGRSSSRVKDLVDIVLIVTTYAFGSQDMLERIGATFGARGSDPIPRSFAQPPASWELGYRTMAGDIGLDPDNRNGHRIGAAFFGPLLAGEVPDGAVWSCESLVWGCKREHWMSEVVC